MPTSPESPKIPSTTSSEGKDDVQGPHTSRKASPEHETSQTMQAAVAGAGDKAEMPPGVAAPPPPGFVVPRPIKTVQCNMMSYTDGEGIARQIYMPKGTARLACTLSLGKRWDDLAKFPIWNNQTYDDWEADEEKYAYLLDELDDHSDPL
ncbi:hypothetical protein Daus18300_009734 [Diaporthe australafricana]|uniref:Uncharacterized protein n=1 Tax=Diaporthe australafricana TaxID=127596 RepID=A0ABR3WDR8_9PEZI